MTHSVKGEKKGKSEKAKAPFGWIVILLVLTGSILSAGVFGVKHFLASSYFRINEVRWRGLHRIDPQELNSQFYFIVGENLIDLDITQLHSELLVNRWIKEAVVRKILPDKVDILVTERVPAALEIDSSGKKLILRDNEGIVLGEGNEGESGLPRMIYFNPKAYKKALTLMPLLAGRSDALVDLSRDDDIRVFLGQNVLRFGDQDFQERWEKFLRVEPDLKRRHLVSWEADLRFPSKVVAREGRYH